ncbi:major facilitator superfamily transporter [Arthrobacter globiformis NBRC 12137]|uniref:Major facilitator superfamily transporter n=1 Tax=Arthrobacter globiformis (strain ATCC 8010 / DSM 20124 / JCM 1332 / NBRC 12137 / NCIMB 8907 / NRRL B-2979 / 168) TaxID=1077972 RepID=H0QK52_ARTG1|nr:major facilitator superfamily transporter [Arthrobacter globiformis NBRC 12137]
MLWRWLIGYGTFGVPQAGAPIAFSLLALSLTGSAEVGAGLVFVMTLAQILGAVPVSRLGSRYNAVTYLRILVAIRTVALAGVAVLGASGASFAALLAAVAAAGLVNGAAYGFQRSLLNHLVEPRLLSRALGVAATLNEVAFAVSPVIVSLLGAVSPVGAVAAMAVLGAGPLVLIPSIPAAHTRTDPHVRKAHFPKEIYHWLFCAAALGAVVSAVEVGAVALAISFNLGPAWAFAFALALCVGSVAGGLWVSIRNHPPQPRSLCAFLGILTLACAVIALAPNIVLTLIAAAFIGFFLPALNTSFSLDLDHLSPSQRRAEVFALLRTANAVGLVAISGVLALAGLAAAFVSALVLAAIACIGTLAVLRGRRRRQLAERPARLEAPSEGTAGQPSSTPG